MTRIAVTGAAGFLGSHLVDTLISQGHEVLGIDNLRRGRIETIRHHIDAGKLRFLQDDIRDLRAISAALSGAEIVFHLAAQSNVMGSMTDPDYSFTTNVIGTYNVLKAASEAGVKRLVFSSSREVYGEPESLPVDERQPTQPKNYYGASKVAGEAYCRAFDSEGLLACTVLRFGNLYGTRDRDRVIPMWLAAAAAGESLRLYGGDKILDFLHVGYAVAALVAASLYADYGPINVASGIGTSLNDLAAQILEMSASRSSLSIEPTRPVEVSRFVANVEKMRTLLHVEPPAEPLGALAGMVHPSQRDRDSGAIHRPEAA
jgi:UDP-glucose 4-epimerase